MSLFVFLFLPKEVYLIYIMYVHVPLRSRRCMILRHTFPPPPASPEKVSKIPFVSVVFGLISYLEPGAAKIFFEFWIEINEWW